MIPRRFHADDPAPTTASPTLEKDHIVTTATASIALAASTLVSGIALAGDALTIRELAPDTAVLVLGADDLRGTIDRLGPTALGKLWNDPAIKDDVAKFKAQFETALDEAAKESGIDRADFAWPASLGLAVMAELDEELGVPRVDFVFFCDWSSEAEKGARFCDAIIAQIEKDAKAGGSELKAEDIRGRRVLVSAFGDAPAEGGDGMDGEEEDAFEDPFGVPDFGPKELAVTSDKGRLFVSSGKAAMDGLLGRVDGDRVKSVGESATFKGATELAGGTQDVYAVLSTEAAKPLMAAMPQFMLAEPIIARLFGDIKAWSFGLHANDGVLEFGAGIYTPAGKAGLLSLIDTATEPKPAPAIVPADALSFGRMNVRFDKLMPMLDEAVGGMPPEMADMLKMQLDMYRPALTAAGAVLGPEMYIWGYEADPANPFGSTTVTAIAMKNDKDSAAAVSDLINLFPMGLQSRDFNGMTIMSDEFAPVAIGIGGGYLVIGEVKQVEQTLRAVDAKGEAGLAGDEGYKAAFAAMSKEPVVGSAWFDLPRQLSSQISTMRMAVEQLEGMTDMEDADVPGLGVGMDEVLGFYDLLKPDVVKRCLGYGTLEFKATPQGFSTMQRMRAGSAS